MNIFYYVYLCFVSVGMCTHVGAHRGQWHWILELVTGGSEPGFSALNHGAISLAPL